MRVVDGRKQCSACRAIKVSSEYHRSRSTSDGLCGQCKSCSAACSRRSRARHLERYRANERAASKRKNFKIYSNPTLHAKLRRYHAEYNRRLKQDTVKAYGGACACCGESTFEFLAVDHINGGGRQHRKSIGVTGGSSMYAWLRRHGFPKSQFQLLCHNCNCAKGFYGSCPHTRSVSEQTRIACHQS